MFRHPERHKSRGAPQTSWRASGCEVLTPELTRIGQFYALGRGEELDDLVHGPRSVMPERHENHAPASAQNGGRSESGISLPWFTACAYCCSHSSRCAVDMTGNWA